MADKNKTIVIARTEKDYANLARLAAQQVDGLDAKFIESTKRAAALAVEFFSNFDAAEHERQIAIDKKMRLALINSAMGFERVNGIEKPKPIHVKSPNPQPLVVPARKTEIVTAHYSICPPQPDNDGWDAVFDWFHKVPRYFCHTLEKLSEMIGKSELTVRKKHMEYVAQHGKYPIGYWDDKK